MKKRIMLSLITVFLIFTLSSCASLERKVKTFTSEYTGGLDRTVNIYSYDGKLIRSLEGKIDVEISDGGKVLFDLNGKRYIYYNCMVEVIEN